MTKNRTLDKFNIFDKEKMNSLTDSLHTTLLDEYGTVHEGPLWDEVIDTVLKHLKDREVLEIGKLKPNAQDVISRAPKEVRLMAEKAVVKEGAAWTHKNLESDTVVLRSTNRAWRTKEDALANAIEWIMDNE